MYQVRLLLLSSNYFASDNGDGNYLCASYRNLARWRQVALNYTVFHFRYLRGSRLVIFKEDSGNVDKEAFLQLADYKEYS